MKYERLFLFFLLSLLSKLYKVYYKYLYKSLNYISFRKIRSQWPPLSPTDFKDYLSLFPKKVVGDKKAKTLKFLVGWSIL